ncbi:MAG: hypothetical protein KBD53_03725 [Candidatus Omnitrophica bacterium]|nr:hypothetical protein [Candidatus Omnitrophota bacterium]
MNIRMFNEAQVNTRPQPQTEGLDLSPLKITALIYVIEALVDEKYEEMRELIHFAREFGATDQEVNIALGF